MIVEILVHVEQNRDTMFVHCFIYDQKLKISKKYMLFFYFFIYILYIIIFGWGKGMGVSNLNTGQIYWFRFSDECYCNFVYECYQIYIFTLVFHFLFCFQFLQKYDDKFIFDPVTKQVSLKCYSGSSESSVSNSPPTSKPADSARDDKQTTCNNGGKMTSATEGERNKGQGDNKNAQGDTGQRQKK